MNATASQTLRAENEWPIARTQYTRLYMNAANGKLETSKAAASSFVSYDAVVPELGEAERAAFDITFDRDTELTGYMKLRVFMSCDAGRRHGCVCRSA